MLNTIPHPPMSTKNRSRWTSYFHIYIFLVLVCHVMRTFSTSNNFRTTRTRPRLFGRIHSSLWGISTTNKGPVCSNFTRSTQTMNNTYNIISRYLVRNPCCEPRLHILQSCIDLLKWLPNLGIHFAILHCFMIKHFIRVWWLIEGIYGYRFPLLIFIA